MSGYDQCTGWCHFTPIKLKRYYRSLEDQPDEIQKRFALRGIPVYFDHSGGLHAKCSDGKMWNILSGQPITFDSAESSTTDFDTEYLTVTDLAANLSPKISAIKVNKLLANLGYQENAEGQWNATKLGLKYSKKFDSTTARFNQTKYLKWDYSLISILQKNNID